MRPSLLFALAGALGGALVTAVLLAPGNAPPGGAGVARAQGVTQLEPVAASAPRGAPPAGHFTPEELANIRVYEAACRGVVNITTSTVEYDRLFLTAHEGQGSGSGSILDRRGHILTNFHVVEGAQEVQVTLHNGDTYAATLVGADAEYDIAVLKIDAPAELLTPIVPGRSDTLRVGQRAYALGAPFGLEGSLTTGIVSSLNRVVPGRVGNRSMTGMIQTDAAMNPGNSGGPLLDSGGMMIGMNVAIASKTGQNTGIGFAIPVDRIKRFVPELIEHGKVIRAYHGIVTLMETPEGLKIARLSRGGPAERAGLRAIRIERKERRQGPLLFFDTRIDHEHADRIVAIDGRPTATHTEFLEVMDAHRPGETVVITVLREGQRVDVPLVLGAA